MLHRGLVNDDNKQSDLLGCPRNILLNYAASHPRSGYTQGMSDLLAPILAEVQQEADAFWCFTGLMTRTIFVSSPTDTDMDKQLVGAAFAIFIYSATCADTVTETSHVSSHAPF